MMENLLCADTFLFPEWKLDKLRRSTEFGGAIHIFLFVDCVAHRFEKIKINI